jgi:lysophospholipase L1-like esterase
MLYALSTHLALGQPAAISQVNWTLHSVDSQETEVGGYVATNAFDGNPATMWATQWHSASPPPPHELQINLGAVYSVSGFRYLPRQDGHPQGRIRHYHFYVSMDGTTWGSAVASGAFSNSATEEQVTFTPKAGQYIRLRAMTEVNNEPWTTIAELNVLATGNQPPNATISAPASPVTIAPGQSVTFSGIGNDPDNNVPLTYAWDFGTGGPPASTSQNPGAVTFPTAGVYTVTFTVRDALGSPDPSPAIQTVTVHGSAAPPISQANWTLHAVDSQETAGGDFAATNAFDGNASTIWSTKWFSSSPPPPHELQINLGGVYAISGFRYLPRQDGQPHGRIGQYQFYVSMDGVRWDTAVATGTFPNTEAEQQVTFATKTGQYVRLRAMTEVNAHPWTTVAELNVLAMGNQPPNGTIDAPASDVTIAPGQSVTFSGTGTDPDNHVPLAYEWSFGAGGPPSSATNNPGAITFPTAGVYSVTLTVRDALGNSDPTPATRTVTVQSAAAAALIPQAGWTVRFVDSEELSGGNFIARNAIDGNPNTAWASQWFGGGPPPPHEIQIDLGAVFNVAGFRYLPYQPWQAGRIGEYEFYVSADGVDWGAPVALGAFPDVNSGEARDVLFPPKTGRYVALRALTEVNNGDYTFTTLAELNVWRASTAGAQPPSASITSPSQDVTVVAGSAINLAGAASDPDSPLTYRWSVGTGSGIADSTEPNGGLVHFDRPGIFTVTFTVTDAFGETAAATRTVTVDGGQPLATTGWTVRSVDSQETEVGNYLATNAFDGKPETIWTTQWMSAASPLPHEIQIDLGATRPVTGFRYLPRQDGITVGNIGKYEFYVSADGVNWGPAASGNFTADESPKEVTFGVKHGRYVRLRALTEVNQLPYTAVAELQILHKQCLGPWVQLLHPRSGYLQGSSTLELAADACLGPSGQGVRFVVDGVAQDDLTAPFQTTAVGVGASEHVIEAYLVDGSGNVIIGDATYDRSAPVGIGDTYVAMGDGITTGYGDDVSTDDNTADGRNLLGGYTPILATGLTAARGIPVAVVNAGVRGSSSASGAASITTLLQQYPSATYFLALFAHIDARTGVRSGLGLTPQSLGYAGSYKDHMQQIISAVRAAGKFVLLAKALPDLPLDGEADTFIQEYNKVIDELAADTSNSVPVVPPDFYNYFKARTTTHYSTSSEPNGLGYESMAQLWLDAILGTQ